MLIRAPRLQPAETEPRDLFAGGGHGLVQRFRGLAGAAQAQHAAVEPAREFERGGVVHGPCGVDEIRHAAREEALREGRREQRGALAPRFGVPSMMSRPPFAQRSGWRNM